MNPIPALRFVFRSATQNHTRNLGISVASLLTVTLTLLGAGAAVLVVHALDTVLHTEESRASVLKVFVADHVSLASIINMDGQLAAQPDVRSVTFENKNEAAREASAPGGLNLKRALRLLERTGGGNPLPASLNLRLRSIADVTSVNQAVRSSAIIYQGPHPTDYNPNVIPRLERYILIAQVAGVLLVAVVGAVALVIITISVRTAAFVRREEIEIMKLVGATEWFVRWPFIVEGMLVGVISAIIAAAVLLGGGFALGSGHTLALGTGVRFALEVSGALIVAGAVLGSFGSVIGVRRSLAV
ncbi:MAG TPA: permease-like cell division protein FtsX [Candidatus Dormibacteraeota bacterium]|nr:permease-like cell division protein FtsX [Candidatus Dormibacteraeota bacterium]